MKVLLQNTAHEKLIGQVLYIEENINDIVNHTVENGSFRASGEAKAYFRDYIGKVESLLKEAGVVSGRPRYDANANRLPFIVLDSDFTLLDNSNQRHYCHLYYGLFRDTKDLYTNVHFLSAEGLYLLQKRQGDTVSVDIGWGPEKYNISSIRIV